MSRRRDIIGVLDSTGLDFTTGSVTVTTTATAIPTTPMSNRKAITVFNMSQSAGEIVYLGNSSVTTATGYPLQPYQGLPFDLGSGAKLYGIVASGTIEVRTMEIDNG